MNQSLKENENPRDSLHSFSETSWMNNPRASQEALKSETSRLSIPRDSRLTDVEEGFETSEMNIGVVGLGLMGSSITTTLAISGYDMIAVAPIPKDLHEANDHLTAQLHHANTLDLLHHPVEYYVNKIKLTEDYSCLKECSLVLECVVEDRNIKSAVYRKIEDEVSDETIIGTNTSAIPISSLQKCFDFPQRFMGIHWAEPAYATRFLEITCGTETDLDLANRVLKWAENWNKEPTLLKKDIRGFITNRLMYAMYREALSLEEEGKISLKDLDKATRYDMGSWIPIMGLFRRMDYMGLGEEGRKSRDLLAVLSNKENRPAIMETMLANKDRGVHSGKGFFTYTKAEAEGWKHNFSRFNRDMYFLSNKFSGVKKSKTEEIKS